MEKKKHFEKGDQVHFIVTEDFVDTANEFIAFCKSNSINTSEAIRAAISNWLHIRVVKEKKLAQLIHGTSKLESIADEYERDVLREV
jgi:hypothetical protein